MSILMLLVKIAILYSIAILLIDMMWFMFCVAVYFIFHRLVKYFEIKQIRKRVYDRICGFKKL